MPAERPSPVWFTRCADYGDAPVSALDRLLAESGLLAADAVRGKSVLVKPNLLTDPVISLEKPQRKWTSPRLKGKTSWIFSSCGRCSRLTTGTSGTRSGGLRKGQSPCEFLGGLSGFLSRRCRGLSPCVE